MNKLNKLLNNSLESYYWLGFLLADGHFSSEGVLSITLSRKDMEHLERLREFLGRDINIHSRISKGFGKEFEVCCLSVMDKSTIFYLRNKYNIDSNKTVYPPDLACIQSREAILSLSLGFIDGDGSIIFQTGREDVTLKIKCHRNWKNFLENLFQKEVRINKEGYCEMIISNNEIIREMKRFAIDKDLPIMKRKWERVDESKESRYISAERLRQNTRYLDSIGMRGSDISFQLGVTKGYISRILNKGE